MQQDTTGDFHTAVLFLIFNRPDTTQRVFETIRQAWPPRLYIAGDGPREGKIGEKEKVNQAREIALQVDWPCEVFTLFREKNLGCREAVGSAITWFFDQEEQGIILEDDCLPHEDFFRFCEVLLDRYKDNPEIFMVSGINLQNGKKWGDASYYFSTFPFIWGWASWRRAWNHYDPDFSFWPEWKKSNAWNEAFPNIFLRKYYETIFERTYRYEIDTWDYIWHAANRYNKSLIAVSNVNLISNIGFGEDATHTIDSRNENALLPVFPIPRIIHPNRIELNTKADDFYASKMLINGSILPRFLKSVLGKFFIK